MLNKINNVFNKNLVCYNENEVVIKESEPNAGVSEFTFTNANFYSFCNKTIDKTNELFKNNRLKKSLTSGCDGLLLFEKEGQWFLFLIELKTSFTTNNIEKAQNQIQTMYPKFMMIVSLLKDFIDLNKIIVKGIIISNLPSIERKAFFLKKSQTNKGYCIEKMCINLITEKKVLIKRENSILKNFNLNECYNFDNMPLYYISSEKSSIDITTLC